MVHEELNKRNEEYLKLITENQDLKEELNKKNDELNQEKKCRYYLQN